MAKLNRTESVEHPKTHEGAIAARISPEQELRRSVMSCLLWEKEFYEDGVSIAQRIHDLTLKVSLTTVAAITIEARERMHLRHAPLWLCLAMAERGGSIVGDTLARVIQRADELTELLAMYWKDGKRPLPAQMKRGLAEAFTKFDEYQLAKYDRVGAIRLRDVLFLVHPKPKDGVQAAIWKRLANRELATPETWEVGLSGGGDKRETFERLLNDRKLGYLALLRNLRNMHDAGVSKALVSQALLAGLGRGKVLPFRFVAAAMACPAWETEIETAMLRSLDSHRKLSGKTIIIVDVSGSMYGARLSERSEMDRARIAATLATFAREVCEEPIIYATAGDDGGQKHATRLVPARRGFALVDAIYELCRPLGGGGIFLSQCMEYVYGEQQQADRVIVVTDEQDTDNKLNPTTARLIGDRNYLINVASNKNGIGYRRWTHIDGWSEAVLDYIMEVEDSQ